MKEKFKNIVFYVNIVVDVIVIGVVIYFLTVNIINNIKLSGKLFEINSINNEIRNYGSIKKIKCDELQNNKIMGLFYNYVIFENGEIYSLLRDDKLYTNNTQCKKIDLSFKIKKVIDSYIVDENNKSYKFETNYNNDNEFELMEIDYIHPVIKKMIADDRIRICSNYYYKNEQKYFVLKDDGNIYEQKYDIKYNDDGTEMALLINENVILSNEIYGNIEYFILNDDGEISLINSSNGLYILSEIGDNCEKYQDAKCDKKLVLSEVYKKYVNDIKYIGSFSLTKENVIFTSEVFNK